MLEIGSVIDGKYKILHVIGRGGMSVVYLAVNERANKSWAVKEVYQNHPGKPETDRQELELMKKLRHPHLPSVVDVIEREHSLLIVMDYVEGHSLETVLQEEGPQSEQTVIAWARQLCDVLSYLHAQDPPVIYRDMKPSNVMRKPDGTVTLIDLGAAREYKPLGGQDTVCLGTRGYAAPEQYAERGQSDARTDIYCLGVMLFCLLTGESPHELRLLRECDPGFSAGLEMIVEKCTRRRKEERYQSCAELDYALEHYRELDLAYRKKQQKKLLTFAAPAAAVLVLGICAGVFAGLACRLQNSSYEACLLAAKNSAGKEEELMNYSRAIALDPFREEAYLELLRQGFLDDGILTAKESERLRAELILISRKGQTNEAVFRQNEAGYARFAYEAGIAYFYKYEEKENKKMARGYFETAAVSGKLEEKQAERAKRLYVIADYYARIGQVDEAGDMSVTYRKYWGDLTELSVGNLVEEDNARTALVMYEELAGQIVSRAAEFKNAGVTGQEMEECLGEIREHLDRDFKNLDEENLRQLEPELKELREVLTKAQLLAASACQTEAGLETEADLETEEDGFGD